jgi:hypothetical protein
LICILSGLLLSTCWWNSFCRPTVTAPLDTCRSRAGQAPQKGGRGKRALPQCVLCICVRHSRSTPGCLCFTVAPCQEGCWPPPGVTLQHATVRTSHTLQALHRRNAIQGRCCGRCAPG